jgi:hypothetical protein
MSVRNECRALLLTAYWHVKPFSLAGSNVLSVSISTILHRAKPHKTLFLLVTGTRNSHLNPGIPSGTNWLRTWCTVLCPLQAWAGKVQELATTTSFQILTDLSFTCYPTIRRHKVSSGIRDSVVVKALCYEIEGRGFETRRCERIF